MNNNTDQRAGHKPSPNDLITRNEMSEAYYNYSGPFDPVKNGTSGHRGVTGKGFSERHVAAMTQALADLREEKGTFGPYFPAELHSRPLGPVIMGKDVRYTSDFAQVTAAEVFAANGMEVIIHKGDRSTPTPVISHSILKYNREGKKNAEGVVITASHNPPEEAGYKSNGLDAGPNTLTGPIDKKANYYMAHPDQIKRMRYDKARKEKLVLEADLIAPYVKDLPNVVRIEGIRAMRFAATPLGGSANGYYEAVNRAHGTRIEEILSHPDPASANRTYDWDGKLRGDPSSEYVMMAIKGMPAKTGGPVHRRERQRRRPVRRGRLHRNT